MVCYQSVKKEEKEKKIIRRDDIQQIFGVTKENMYFQIHHHHLEEYP